MTQKNRFFSFVIDFDFFLRCGLLSKCVPIDDVRFATARRLLTTNYTRIENSDSNREKKKYIATRGSRSRLSLEHTYLDCVCVCCYLCAVLYHGTLFFFSSARSEPRQHRINPMDNPFFFFWPEIQQDHNEHLLGLLVSHSKWLLFAFLCMAAPQSRRWANFLFVLYCRF